MTSTVFGTTCGCSGQLSTGTLNRQSLTPNFGERRSLVPNGLLAAHIRFPIYVRALTRDNM